MIRGAGGGGRYSGLAGILAHTPTHQITFPQGKNEIYQRGERMEGAFRYRKFLWPQTPPPLPGYGIHRPLSHPLTTTSLFESACRPQLWPVLLITCASDVAQKWTRINRKPDGPMNQFGGFVACLLLHIPRHMLSTVGSHRLRPMAKHE